MKKLFLTTVLLFSGFFVLSQGTTNSIYGTFLQGTNIYSPTPSSINNTYIGTRVAASGSANALSDNTCVGFESAFFSKDAAQNSFLGYRSGRAIIDGSFNVFLGADSGFSNTNGSRNVFSGTRSGNVNVTGNDNTFYGTSSGRQNTVSGNTFIGSFSGDLNTTGLNNVFLGFHSGRNNTLGFNNTFLGFEAGLSNIGTVHPSVLGNYNTFVGKSAGSSNTTGSSNVYLGSEAGSNSNSSYNVLIGHYAGQNKSGGGSCVFIGHGAGLGNLTGFSNVFLGHQSGLGSTGSKNVLIGSEVGKTETDSNKLHIGSFDPATPNIPPLLYGDFFSRKIGIGLPNVFAANSDRFPVTAQTGTVNLAAYKLFVKGGILTEVLTISPFNTWADYVFDKNYKLKSLSEVELFINKNGHLPNIPSALTIAKEGMEIKNIITLQQEKIEELTLYLIQQNKSIEELKNQVKGLLEKTQ